MTNVAVFVPSDLLSHLMSCNPDSPAWTLCACRIAKTILAQQVPQVIDEKVNHPQHYGGDTTYETIKVLEAWLEPSEFRGFLVGNAIKYLSRAGKKGSRLEDEAKAQWYVDRLNEFDRQGE